MLLRPNSKEAQRKREDQTFLSQERFDLWQMGMCGWLVLPVIYQTHLKNAVTLCGHLAMAMSCQNRMTSGRKRVYNVNLIHSYLFMEEVNFLPVLIHTNHGGELLHNSACHSSWTMALVFLKGCRPALYGMMAGLAH